MSKNIFVFTKEMAELLKKARTRSGLTQSELAERIGLSAKTGYGYISHLEKGFLKNIRYPLENSVRFSVKSPFQFFIAYLKISAGFFSVSRR